MMTLRVIERTVAFHIIDGNMSIAIRGRQAPTGEGLQEAKDYCDTVSNKSKAKAN